MVKAQSALTKLTVDPLSFNRSFYFHLRDSDMKVCRKASLMSNLPVAQLTGRDGFSVAIRRQRLTLYGGSVCRAWLNDRCFSCF